MLKIIETDYSTHTHIPRNNPAKFHENPMDSLGGADNKSWTDGELKAQQTEGQG